MKPPRIYFSFRSPYSWLALDRIWAEAPDVASAAELIPYWDPDPATETAVRSRGAGVHYVQMSKPKHLYLLQDTKRLAQRRGLAMAWPIDIDPWWEVPHLAWLAAGSDGSRRALYLALTEARWGRGENICDPEVLGKAAAAAGLDGDSLAAATEDPGVRAGGVDCLVRAYEDDVFGVPYFRVGRHRFWGYDRVDDFVDAVRGTAPTPVPVTAAAAGYDSDTAGGCG